MKGFDWSIWYVPTNWKEFMVQHDMTHIPHVTWETHLREEPKEMPDVKFIENLNFTNIGTNMFPSMYKGDSINFTIGWYCEEPLWWDKPHIW